MSEMICDMYSARDLDAQSDLREWYIEIVLLTALVRVAW
jgi:hypothetical protein